jgi:hypothetical protein
VRSPEELALLLADMPGAMSRILGANLVGLYLYGSVCDETFDVARSDVDCIAVTGRALTEVELDRLGDWFAEVGTADPWVERLQMSFLIRRTILEEDSGACLFQFGVLSRSGSDGNPLIWLDYLQRGAILSGAAPESFLPDITREMLREALVREIGYLRQEMCVDPEGEWRDKLSYRVYAVLTLCRILYSARTGRVATKARAGAWALEHVSSEWHELIHRALGDASSDGLTGLVARRICAFIEYAQAEVDSLQHST